MWWSTAILYIMYKVSQLMLDFYSAAITVLKR